jgi:hypothetical protein
MTDFVDRQEASDIAKLRIHEYFDHYLTDVFPKTVRTVFAAHNQDVAAHQDLLLIHEKTCRSSTTIKRWKWMLAGGSLLIGAAGAIGVDRLLKVLGAF